MKKEIRTIFIVAAFALPVVAAILWTNSDSQQVISVENIHSKTQEIEEVNEVQVRSSNSETSDTDQVSEIINLSTKESEIVNPNFSKVLSERDIHVINTNLKNVKEILGLDPQTQEVFTSLANQKILFDKDRDGKVERLIQEMQEEAWASLDNNLTQDHAQEIEKAKADVLFLRQEKRALNQEFEDSLRNILSAEEARKLEAYEREIFKSKTYDIVKTFIDQTASFLPNVQPHQQELFSSLADQVIDQDLGAFYLGSTLQRHGVDSPQYQVDATEHILAAAELLNGSLTFEQQQVFNIENLRK